MVVNARTVMAFTEILIFAILFETKLHKYLTTYHVGSIISEYFNMEEKVMYFGNYSNRNTKDANRFAPSSFSALMSLSADIADAMSVLFICAIIAIIMISVPLAIIISAIIIPVIMICKNRALPSKR